MAAKKRPKPAPKKSQSTSAARHATARAKPAAIVREVRVVPHPPAPPGARRRPPKPALVALVPSSYNAEGETNAFLRAYKTKWLSKLDFKSDANVQSLLLLAILVLALGRDAEAESVVDRLIQHVDLRFMNEATKGAMASALRLAAYLQTKRGDTAEHYLARARELARYQVHQDREWLSNDAPGEVADAVARKKLELIAYPFAGVVRWLNEPAARPKAELLLAELLAGARTLMTSQ